MSYRVQRLIGKAGRVFIPRTSLLTCSSGGSDRRLISKTLNRAVSQKHDSLIAQITRVFTSEPDVRDFSLQLVSTYCCFNGGAISG